MAHTDSDRATDMDSEDDFDALELGGFDSQAHTAALHRQGMRETTMQQSWQKISATHQFHACDVCRHWDLFQPRSGPLVDCYSLRTYQALYQSAADNCVFINLCRRQFSSFQDGGRLLIELEKGANSETPVVGSVVSIKLDAGISSSQRLVLRGFVHPNPENTCSCSRKLLRQHPSHHALLEAKTRIQLCEENHSNCSKREVYRPLRLIHIHSPKHIVLYTPSADEVLHYAVLSYCWGGPQECATTRSNFSGRSWTGMSCDELSRTMQEAVQVSLQLGLKYLWADCLCIIQDDENDKEVQISQMPKIYAAADVTIAASCGGSVRDGFLESWTPPVNLVRFRVGETQELYVAVSNQTTDDIEPLDTRAWALQEMMLSKRVLNFQTKSLVFECPTSNVRIGNKEGDHTEMHQLPSLRTLSDQILSGHSDRAAWRELVAEYCRRQLTLPDDRLLAISGLADRYAPHFGSKYLAGIWQSALPLDLMWYCVNPGPRPKAERAPTWSWAAIDGLVSFNVNLLSRFNTDNQEIAVHDASVIPCHPGAKYGAVRQGGCICLSAFMRPVTIVGSGEDRIIKDPTRDVSMTMKLYWDATDDKSTTAYLLNYYMTNADISRKVTSNFYTVGLVVVACPGSDRGFRRVGMYHAEGRTAWFAKSDLETVHLH